MANFGETLTYWYLRLNGFFPLTNFVLHRTNRSPYSADTDLLAVRFKHVYEEIGGQPTDWDDWFQRNNLEFNDRVTALIVEVKTGHRRPENIERSFSPTRIESAVRRFGFYREEETVQRRILELRQQGITTSRRYQIAKVLVTTYPTNLTNYPPCLHITLPEIEQFITQRMERYANRKSGDRFFFPDDLIQYFAWKARDNG